MDRFQISRNEFEIMKIVTILLCLFVIPSAAQKMDSGRIEYIVKTIDTATLNLTEKDALAAQKYINDLSQGIKDKIIITEFNGMQSLSYEKKNMKLDSDKWSNFQSSLLDAQGLFFYNNDTKELLNQVETLGDRFIIEKKNTTLKWTLLKDKKKVDKYTCFKAIRADTTRSVNKNIIKKYIAWYTPEIPIATGPLEHVGLPGLILELNVLGSSIPFTLSAEKIILNPSTEIIVKKPTKGRSLSENEFDSLMRIAVSEILSTYKKD